MYAWVIVVAFPSFPNLEGLTSLARRDGVDIRPTLLRVLTDLYVQKTAHTADEDRHYTELALRLLDAVDISVRQIVARRLAAYPGVPPAVLERLARDIDVVAGIVQGHGRDADSAAPTARHPAAIPIIAEQHERPQPMRKDLSDLFFAANTIERRLILLNIDYAPIVPAQRISPALAAETIACLEVAAMARNGNELAAVIARACEMPLTHAERVAADPFGEPIVVVGKALAMPADILQRILLFLNPAIGHSVARVYDLAELFDEITPRAARRMIAIWRGRHFASTAAHHAPLYWDDERTGSREMASPQPRRSEPRLGVEQRHSGRRRPRGA